MSAAASLTAYPGIEAILTQQLREAEIDHDAFSLRLLPCELPKCRATCCHDGALLTTEEMDGISRAVEAHRPLLAGYGWSHTHYLSPDPTRPATRTIPAAAGELAAAFPAHFPRTRCVFLDRGHRCVLQRLAQDSGRHPWWWKPVSCWMHPLLLRPPTPRGRPLLTLARPGMDPAAAAGYAGFGSCTPCGVERPDGVPAWQALQPELELLERISGRRLLGEIRADSAGHAAQDG